MIFQLLMIFILGLCAGSFINMLVFRTARKYGLEKEKYNNSNRSFCDFCGKQLHWYENVPVISWLIQGGKSRCCGKKLSLTYPVVELVVGLLFLINQRNWLGMVVITMLIFSAVFDLKYMILPSFSSYILIAIALIKWQNLPVGIAAYIIFWLLAKLKIKGKQAMGEGDAPLAAFMGLWLGWPLALVAFYIAFIIGAIIGGAMILLKRKRGDSQIPFGPFLILGTLTVYFFGAQIMYYLNVWL